MSRIKNRWLRRNQIIQHPVKSINTWCRCLCVTKYFLSDDLRIATSLIKWVLFTASVPDSFVPCYSVIPVQLLCSIRAHVVEKDTTLWFWYSKTYSRKMPCVEMRRLHWKPARGRTAILLFENAKVFLLSLQHISWSYIPGPPLVIRWTLWSHPTVAFLTWVVPLQKKFPTMTVLMPRSTCWAAEQHSHNRKSHAHLCAHDNSDVYTLTHTRTHTPHLTTHWLFVSSLWPLLLLFSLFILSSSEFFFLFLLIINMINSSSHCSVFYYTFKLLYLFLKHQTTVIMLSSRPNCLLLLARPSQSAYLCLG